MSHETLDDIKTDLYAVSVERSGVAVDYSPYIRIALRLVIYWFRHKLSVGE